MLLSDMAHPAHVRRGPPGSLDSGGLSIESFNQSGHQFKAYARIDLASWAHCTLQVQSLRPQEQYCVLTQAYPALQLGKIAQPVVCEWPRFSNVKAEAL